MRKVLFFCFFIIASLHGFSQVDHWESVILEGDNYRYLVPGSQPPTDWVNQNFDDSGWNEGPSGFGYGDGDDNTNLNPGTVSVYLRKKFDIVDITKIDRLLFHLDFDDGFIAYINGQEIERRNMNGNPPAYNEFSSDLQEGRLYQGLTPERFEISPSLLQNGENILAVQVHNFSAESSDLTAIPFLMVGINTGNYRYRSNPPWFTPPTDFYSSDLPIVMVNTNGRVIQDEPKIMADFGIIFNGPGIPNTVADPWNEYNGFCGIELRGESSLSFEKKSYGLEIWDAAGQDMDAAFLNFPAEEDFILNGPYSDKTLLNNTLAMHIANRMGQYASRTRFVELVVNQEYMGIYVLMERIKVDENRLDIAKLNPDEISGDDVTGGYVIRIDKGNDPGFASPYNAFNSDNRIFFRYFYPKGDDIRPEQSSYIRNYVLQFERAMASEDGFNDDGYHYTHFMNLRSFVDNFILNELSKNVDAYRLSTYFHKDKESKGGKLTSGPVWDYNLSFGNGDYCGGDRTDGYEYYQCQGNSPFWWDTLLKDTLFTNALKCRWNELRAGVLHVDSLENFIDQNVEDMGSAIDRNYERWQTLGIYIWPNPSYFATPTTHQGIILSMKNWIRNRIAWLDNNLPGTDGNCAYYDSFTEIPKDGEEIILGLDPELPSFSIFPNPANGLLNIRGEENLGEIRIYNSFGQLVYQQENIRQRSIQLNLGLPAGNYILTIQNRDKFSRHKVILIR